MIAVALLRGINVGGNNKIDMKQLKVSFEALGFESVKTYINSGNIIFKTNNKDLEALSKMISMKIEEDFNLSIKVLIRTFEDIDAVIKEIPNHYANNQEMKCDVMFLWDEESPENIHQHVHINPDVDQVHFTNNAFVVALDKVNYNKSGFRKLIGTPIYKQMTIRNINTVRKVHHLMQSMD